MTLRCWSWHLLGLLWAMDQRKQKLLLTSLVPAMMKMVLQMSYTDTHSRGDATSRSFWSDFTVDYCDWRMQILPSSYSYYFSLDGAKLREWRFLPLSIWNFISLYTESQCWITTYPTFFLLIKSWLNILSFHSHMNKLLFYVLMSNIMLNYYEKLTYLVY